MAFSDSCEVGKRTGTRCCRRLGFAAAAVALVLGVAACGSGGGSSTTAHAQNNLIKSSPANAKTTITVGSKNFGEEFVLGEIYAQALRAAGYHVNTRLDLGSEKVALKAVEDNRISGYPEYTSTALGSFFHVPSRQIPSNATRAYKMAAAYFARVGIVAFAPTPFADSNAVGVLTSTARRLGLRDISDLAGKSRNLVLAGSVECQVRMDCLAGLQSSYGLASSCSSRCRSTSATTVLDNGAAAISILFTSDAQLASLTRYTILRDDKGLIPPGNVMFIAARKVVDAAGPDLSATIQKVQGNLTLPVIQELNYRVDIGKQSPATVARQYLTSLGYVK